MPDLELNKIVASVLLAGVIAMLVGFAADGLYEIDENPKQRGYQLAHVQATSPAAGVEQPKEEEHIDIEALLKGADASNGAKIFTKCAACHDATKGGPNKVGPNLYAVVGAKHAHMPTYSYSSAMLASTGTWTHQELAEFLHNPRKHIPGTKMSFIGLSKPQEIADVIKYLESSAQ